MDSEKMTSMAETLKAHRGAMGACSYWDKLTYKGMGISTDREQTEFWITDMDTYRASSLAGILDQIDELTRPLPESEVRAAIAEDWERTLGR